ncbi:hypothetical protein D3C80_1896330 [compost metagenome]
MVQGARVVVLVECFETIPYGNRHAAECQGDQGALWQYESDYIQHQPEHVHRELPQQFLVTAGDGIGMRNQAFDFCAVESLVQVTGDGLPGDRRTAQPAF